MQAAWLPRLTPVQPGTSEGRGIKFGGFAGTEGAFLDTTTRGRPSPDVREALSPALKRVFLPCSLRLPSSSDHGSVPAPTTRVHVSPDPVGFPLVPTSRDAIRSLAPGNIPRCELLRGLLGPPAPSTCGALHLTPPRSTHSSW